MKKEEITKRIEEIQKKLESINCEMSDKEIFYNLGFLNSMLEILKKDL